MRYHKYEYKDIVEEYAQKCMKESWDTFKIHDQSLKAFTDKVLTGKEFYYVDFQPGMRREVFEHIPVSSVYWSSEGDQNRVQHGRWVMINRKMHYSAVLDKFGHKMDPEQRKTLKTLSNYPSNANLQQTASGGAVFSPTPYSGSSPLNSLDVSTVFFRVPRKIYVKISPNKYNEEEPFMHFMNEEPKRLRDGEQMEVRYVDDIWEGTMIGSNMVIGVQRRPIQLRDPETFEVVLPVFGKSYNGSEKPYSIMWACRNLQKESDLLRYHRRLMLALAGVKGIVMDKSQKPADMSDKEWMYNRKLGVTHIDSTRNKRATYNQFVTYDDTVSPSIQYIDNMLVGVQETVHSITGVSRQALGQIVNTDQVGTNNSAIQQTSLVTEIMYYDSDVILSEALTYFLNILRVSRKDGGIIKTYDPEEGIDAMELPKGVFEDSKFKLYCLNNSKDDEKFNKLQEIMYQNFARGEMDSATLVGLVNVDSVKELEKKLEYYGEKAKEMMAANAGSQMEAEKEKIAFEKQLDNEIKQQELQIKDRLAKVEEARLQVENMKLDLERQSRQQDVGIKSLELASENEIERAYLGEQMRSNRTNEALQAMQMKLTAMSNELNAAIQHNANNKKIEVDKMKARKSEHIKD